MKPPPSAPPTLEVVGYELEIRRCRRLYARFEGRVIKLLRYEGDNPRQPYRCHYLPDHGPATNGRIFVTTQPYWARARSQERLEAKLRGMLEGRLKQLRDAQAKRIPVDP